MDRIEANKPFVVCSYIKQYDKLKAAMQEATFSEPPEVSIFEEIEKGNT